MVHNKIYFKNYLQKLLISVTRRSIFFNRAFMDSYCMRILSICERINSISALTFPDVAANGTVGAVGAIDVDVGCVVMVAGGFTGMASKDLSLFFLLNLSKILID